MLCALLFPLLWLPAYLKSRKKGWLANARSGRVIQEFLNQKNWNALYQEKLESYLLDQLKHESKAWILNNRARNLFYLIKELCLPAPFSPFSKILLPFLIVKFNFEKTL